jgi:hypothetical protein
MEMSSKTNKKDCCQRTLILKVKAQRLQWKMWKALCSAPSVNTAIPHYNQFEIKSSNFNFSSKQKFYQSVSFTSAGYAAIWLIPKMLKPITDSQVCQIRSKSCFKSFIYRVFPAVKYSFDAVISNIGLPYLL